MADVSLFVSSDDTVSERRISPQWTISYLKSRLERITGIPSSSQELSIYIAESETPVRLIAPVGRTEDDVILSEFQEALVPLARLHVSDTRPISTRQNFEDVSQVEKFELTDAEYEARPGTVRAYKKLHKLGRFAENKNDNSSNQINYRDIVSESGITVGSRCFVNHDDRRGSVRYIGRVPELPSLSPSSPGSDTNDIWIGIAFDEPVGKNDGSVQGRRYFTANPKFGSFVRPDKITVGNFPPLDDFDLDEDDEEEI
ncbi:CAP Gly-rich domain-containing protein [Lipomyces oligophaga]|uniref:CAP Gly-rich domain-containing protein n=1 Tax=Lipomyces oligophaga TaxID=45792 RepID=UPI0034CF67B8